MRLNKSEQNAPASRNLLNKLKRATGLNTENCYISVVSAMNLLDNVNSGWDIESDLRSLGATGRVSKKYLEKINANV